MSARRLRFLSWVLLFHMFLGLGAPAWASGGHGHHQVHSGDRYAPTSEGKLAARSVARVHAGLRKALQKMVAAANRSPRVDLELAFSLVDREERMLFDLAGTVRARVPGRKLRQNLQADMEAGRSRLARSNGPISVDLVVTPRAIEGDEVTFAVQLDISILTHRLLGELTKYAAHVGLAAGLHGILHHVEHFIEHLHLHHAGHALGHAINETAHVLSDTGLEIPLQAYQGTDLGSLRSRLGASASVHGLWHHFLHSLVFVAVTSGTKIAASSIGGILGAVLAPQGGAFLTLAASTTATVWFGSWVVRKLTLDLPMQWRLSRLERLHRKALAAPLEERDSFEERAREIQHKLAEKVLSDLDRKHDKWTALRVLTVNLGRRRQAALEAGETWQRAPFEHVIQAVIKRLTIMGGGEDWYAARMYWQFKAALGELPEKEPPPQG